MTNPLLYGNAFPPSHLGRGVRVLNPSVPLGQTLSQTVFAPPEAKSATHGKTDSDLRGLGTVCCQGVSRDVAL
jgi:hypothetical protein